MRPYRGEQDLARVLELLLACLPAGQVDMEIRSIELRTLLADPDFDAERWTLLRGAPGGELRSFALLWGGHVLGMLARPEARGGEEEALLDWAASRVAAERLIVLCRDDDAALMARLQRRGFVVGQEELRLERDLASAIDEPRLPAGFRIRPLDVPGELAEWEDLYRASIGPRERAIRKWRAYRSDPDYLPELDLVAVDGHGRIAAACTCTVASLELGRSTIKEGRTEPIMVGADYRRLGLGRAIVLTGLLLLAARGLDVARLTMEPGNHPACRLYTSLGYRPIYQALWYRQPRSVPPAQIR